MPEEICLPADGIYAGEFRGEDGVWRPAAISLGRRPTFYDDAPHSLLEAYLHLPAFADVRDGLTKLKHAGYRLVALTNGTARSARMLLQNAGLSEYLEAIVSAER